MIRELFMRKDGKKDYCTWSPDVVLGVDIGFKACKWHDEDYYKKKRSRKEADVLFRDRIFKAFKDKNKKIAGYVVSRIYYIAVRLFGGFRY